MKYKIIKEETIFDDFFQIKKARIEHDLFNEEKIEVDRLCFERGDSVSILIYEKDTDCFLFTNQFRYPTINKEDGWILEITAGAIELDEDPIYSIKREVEEEIGYNLKDIEFINSFFVSPGGTSERIFLYFSEVNTSDMVFEGGGMKKEQEDIQLVKMKADEVLERYKNNQFRDAKTILAIQWYLLHNHTNLF